MTKGDRIVWKDWGGVYHYGAFHAQLTSELVMLDLSEEGHGIITTNAQLVWPDDGSTFYLAHN